MAPQRSRPGTFSLASAVELAVLERSGFIESRHAGSAVVVSPDGTVIEALGDVVAPVFARSCLKPFQALAIRECGVELTPEQTALSTASHGGTPRHVGVVRSILAQEGLRESDLRCPADWPGDSGARDGVVRASGGRERVYMNCSGKHAAMLVACARNGWPLESYLSPSHPLQRAVVDVIERLCGEPVAHSGVDGCGAPVHAISLTALARGISRIAQGATADTSFLTQAVLSNGWAIDSPGHANTLVIERLGLFAKLGAEGVMVMSTTGGTAVSLKILDGNLRAATIVALTLLVRAGAVRQFDVDDLSASLGLAVLGGGEPVGSIRVSALS